MARKAATTFALMRVVQSLIAVLLTSASIIYPASAHENNRVHVKAGQSIQAAVDAAHQGACIIVEAGTYPEQVTIKKDGISLVGYNAVIVPPSIVVPNECSGLAGPDTEAGICVVGSAIELADYVQEHRKVLSVGQTVKHVSVNNMEVRGFSGENIAVVGGEYTQVTNNMLYDGVQYGFLTAGSKNTLIAGNTIIATSKILSIGLCNDDMSPAEVLDNFVSGYFVGLCIQTNGAIVRDNHVTKSCIDAFIDPGVVGAHVQQNTLSDWNPECGDPSAGAGGIFIFGAIDSDVSFNLIYGQKAGGLAAGIVIVDSAIPPFAASGNVVAENVLKDNDFDIYVNTTGTGNVIVHNQCSTPAALCG